MYLMGENDVFLGATDADAAKKKSTVEDWLTAGPAGVANIIGSIAALKKKPTQKVIIQQDAPSPEPKGDTGLETWHWVAIGVGAVAILGAGAYLLAKKRK